MEIKALAMDVDGVLTDGRVCWGAAGEESKRFSFRDIMGLSLGRRAGLKLALVSGEAGPILDRFAAKMGIEDVFQGYRDKAGAVAAFAGRHQLPLGSVCFIGDDVNDLEAMALVGLSVCPADAHPSVRRKAQWILAASGGHGAVRELIDRLLGEAES